MNKQETAVILRVLRLSYPAFYSKLGADDYDGMTDLWATIFADDDARIVTFAVRDLIQTHTGFPPEIADVRDKITELVRASTGEPTDEEYWVILRRALSNSLWGAQREFDALPEPLKRYCGSPSWLRDHAVMDTEVVDSVVHGQFLKQFPAVKKAQEYRDSMPEPLKAAIAKLYKPLDGGEYKPLNEPDFQTARQSVIRALEGV